MSLSKEFQERFIELADNIEETGKSQRAKIIGISNTTYSNAYNYGIVPKTSSLMRIADYFNISVEYLIANTDDEHFEKSAHPKQFKERLLELITYPLFMNFRKNFTYTAITSLNGIIWIVYP